MKAYAYKVLDRDGDFPLDDYTAVRIPRGERDWIDVEIRDGEVLIRGSRGLAIEPDAANTVCVRVRP